jgi:hypothetical protein
LPVLGVDDDAAALEYISEHLSCDTALLRRQRQMEKPMQQKSSTAGDRNVSTMMMTTKLGNHGSVQPPCPGCATASNDDNDNDNDNDNSCVNTTAQRAEEDGGTEGGPI